CRYSKGNGCGVRDEPGTCGWPVDACDKTSGPVCGCNGTSYATSCEAHRDGASIVHVGSCVPCREAAACASVANGKKPTFCRTSDGQCGRGREGVCWLRPAACPDGGVTVYGCDGKSYASACEARRIGIDVAHEGSCPASFDSTDSRK